VANNLHFVFMLLKTVHYQSFKHLYNNLILNWDTMVAVFILKPWNMPVALMPNK
jgi:hypothetical protein